jgi:pyruvate dehydrogenase E2 component (dihydrolipoamide acetyltransferase)
MAISIVMPKLGFTMTKGTVVEWLIKPGEKIKKGAGIVTISYEKSTNEIESPISGVLLKIIMNEDEEAQVGEVIGIIEN